MQLILFSPPNYFREEIKLLNQFLQNKFLTVHIRKPNFSEDELRQYLNEIKVDYHCQLVIHNHIHLLKNFKLKGYHCTRFFLEKEERNIEILRKEYPNVTFSKSCHSLEELKSIKDYDYVFLSPIFNSISKDNYLSTFNLNEVTEALKYTKNNVIASGGISSSNIQKLKECKFNSVGVLGAVWNSSEPEKEYEEIKKLL